MKTLRAVPLALLMVFAAEPSHGDFTGKGHVHVLSESKQVFVNSDCRFTATCDLKRFTLTALTYEVWFSDDPEHPTHGNGVIMEYETDSVAALERYAIVQFKKGCVYYSSKNRDGSVRRIVGDRVPSFGADIPFCFPRWVIDSQDVDPVYNSDPGYGRFYLLRWNKPGSYDHRTQKYYGTAKPKKPVVYMTDYPAGAFVTATGARNVALSFNNCIYRAGDVPAVTRRDDLHFAEPIHCFQWQSVFVYDFAQDRFQTRLAGVPWWEVPKKRIDWHLLMLLTVLCIAVTLLACRRLARCSRRGTELKL